MNSFTGGHTRRGFGGATQATQSDPQLSQSEERPLHAVAADDAISDERDASDAELSEDDDGVFFEVTMPAAIELFKKHRRAPLSARSIQDYCDKKQIAAKKFTSGENQGWNMNEASLLKFIMARPEVTLVIKQPETVDPAVATTPPTPVGDTIEATPSEAKSVDPADPTASELRDENARLHGQLTTQETIITTKDEVIANMREDVKFLREEITDKRKINQDLKEIMTQMLDVIDHGINQNQQIRAGKDERAADTSSDTIEATVITPEPDQGSPVHQ
jgi:hypothetical protein